MNSLSVHQELGYPGDALLMALEFSWLPVQGKERRAWPHQALDVFLGAKELLLLV